MLEYGAEAPPSRLYVPDGLDDKVTVIVPLFPAHETGVAVADPVRAATFPTVTDIAVLNNLQLM